MKTNVKKHLAQVRALFALSLHHHGHPRERSLFTLIHSTLYFPSLPPVCLPLPFLPPQRRAAAGARQVVHGKPAQLRQQRE